ncbi:MULTISPECIES: glutathione peroxidase [Salimicrobium]|uniref:Glutathione peroxidase n=2 Tax=Salimicrobium TaxID=351195 RepID=A0ABY1KXA4_9BACI|nr:MULTISPECIES: glutathione peroxidase [Salimicrobium]SDX87830.1 glutathione peroxidase [Salimicrobium album]SIS88916.1 glutathione peroxidase [Salimicrobium salexigens]
MSVHDISVTKENGETYSLDAYKGKVLMIVNTATKCGLKGQFDELEELYKKYQDEGFVVLGFPSNQFANQEPGSAQDAAEQCRLNYGVTFPMHEKIKVNGDDTHELFRHLKEQSGGMLGDGIKWNFTKFLVDQDGNVVERYAPQTSPKKAEEDIRKLVS